MDKKLGIGQTAKDNLTVRGERWFVRIVRSQRSQTLAQITIQLNDGASRTPPRSPDLNPIKHACNGLEQGVKNHPTPPPILTELWTDLANIWQVIHVERFQKLVETMPRRVAAVTNSTGDPTLY
ncbi:DDE_3 domain-containing protein [Trichonephila clavipes]|uniref:DDE_3 domain-containing protein n=1 Tax=Trichonephila clavipes TaxID=2585209 RepID=A0A8X6S1K2_TRICX|nr:DDE_3 domain-containing protein [Trichonephila clavipes]